MDLPSSRRALFGSVIYKTRFESVAGAKPAPCRSSAFDGRSLKPAFAAALALAAALSLSVAQAANLRRHEFTLVGWSADLCSCAIEINRYSSSDVDRKRPSSGAVGTLTLAMGSTQTQEVWRYKNGLWSYDPGKANEATLELLSSGFSDPGTVETLREEALAGHGGLQPILMTAAGFAPSKIDWPAEPYRLTQVHYAPFSTCGLLVFESKDPEGLIYRIASFPDSTRRTRARAHVTNGLLLIKGGRIDGGMAELQIATEMDPTYATARYHYASYLATMSRYDLALNELKAAVLYDKKYAAKARKATEFHALRKDPKFRKLIQGE